LNGQKRPRQHGQKRKTSPRAKGLRGGRKKETQKEGKVDKKGKEPEIDTSVQ